MHDGNLVRQYNAAEFESDYKSFMNDILMKGLSASGYLQDGFSFYDVFGAPGSGAIFGNAMQDIEQVRGWNAAGVMANSFQTVMSTVFVFCSPEEASRLEYQTGEDAVSASRVTGIEHYRVPSDWVQAPLSHPVARIMSTPNPWEDESVWKFRLQQNIEAHGVAYVLVLPNEYGEPKWMFVIPKNGIRPEMASAQHPEGTYKTGQLSRLSNWTPSTRDSTPETFQEALAWISNRQFSAKYVIPIGIPSLLYMDDYFNPTSAMADVLDTDSEIHRSRRNTLRRQASKGPRIEPKDGVDLQPEEWEQILEAYTTEYCGSENAGRPRRTPRNVTITDDSHNAREMEFTQSSGQIRDDILGLRGVPLGFFGLGQQGGYAGVVAQVKSYAALRSQPMQRIISGQLTLGLRRFFKDKHRQQFTIVMQAASLDDPQQKLHELTTDMQFLAPHMTVGEYCKMRNIELQDDSKYNMPLVPQQQMGGIPRLPGQEGPQASGDLPNIGAALSGVEAKPEAPQQAAQEAPQTAEFENAKKGIEETVKAYSSDSVRRAVAAVLLTKFGMSEQAANAILQEVDSEKAKQQAEYDKAEQAKKTLLAKSYFDDMFAGMRTDGEHTRYAANEIEIDTTDVDLSYRDRYTPVEDSGGELRKCLDRLMFGDIGRNRRRFQKSSVDNCGTGAGGFQPGNRCANRERQKREINVYLSKLADVIGDEWEAIELAEQLQSDPSDYGNYLNELKTLYSKHYDKRRDWAPSWEWEWAGDESERFEDETDKEFNLRKSTIYYRESIRAFVVNDLSESRISKTQRLRYLAEMEGVISRMPLRALQEVKWGVMEFKWYPNLRELNKQLKGDKDRPTVAGGFVSFDESRGDGRHYSVNLNGDSSLYNASEIYAHELGHVVERNHPRSESWKTAWKSESSKLSNYATTNEHEGFAEFARLIWSTGAKMSQSEVEQEFPLMSAEFKKYGYM